MRMEKNMTIRHSKTSDLPRLMEIFDVARSFMAETGNPKQWVDGYPSEEVIMEDIGNGDSYVVEKDDKVVATFVLRYVVGQERSDLPISSPDINKQQMW